MELLTAHVAETCGLDEAVLSVGDTGVFLSMNHAIKGCHDGRISMQHFVNL